MYKTNGIDCLITWWNLRVFFFSFQNSQWIRGPIKSLLYKARCSTPFRGVGAGVFGWSRSRHFCPAQKLDLKSELEPEPASGINSRSRIRPKTGRLRNPGGKSVERLVDGAAVRYQCTSGSMNLIRNRHTPLWPCHHDSVTHVKFVFCSQC